MITADYPWAIAVREVKHDEMRNSTITPILLNNNLP